MSKKNFLNLIKLASQPLPEGAKKRFRDDDYNDRQILRRTTQDSKAKLRGKSRP